MTAIYDDISALDIRSTDVPTRRIVDTLINLLALSPPATLADIGAGTGNYSRAVADLGFRVLAIEPSATMHRQALPHASVNWHFD